MEQILWKKFYLGDLFEFASGSTFALKEYNLISNYEDGYVEVVTSSKDNINNYILKEDIPKNCPIYLDGLTINRNGSIGYCFYHKNEFIVPTGDSYSIIHKNKKFQEILNPTCNIFISVLITRIFTKSVYGYSYKVNSDRFDREIILLPCIEVTNTDDYVWKENDHYYTLATEYIEKIMDEAKELREEKTIKLYEAERKKYEAERKKYEEGYKTEKNNVVWKSFTLGSFLEYSSKHTIKEQIKNLHIYEEYE